MKREVAENPRLDSLPESNTDLTSTVLVQNLVTEDTQQRHTSSSHFTSLHPQLHHHRSSFTDHVTDLEADRKTKERRERSSPALILIAPQLVTCSPSLADVAPPENQETPQLAFDQGPHPRMKNC
ncbi:hypothetical protein F2Q68_00005348 [Brassica cretica]|uniref:Uncharacterized protein n=1 Tax=Brassica cretica TaxID=69181 RepID=A0A8S9JCC1_BRACR|nr:hypothetical protein F2Q68_00005348 [Brassica cretica]